MYSYPPHKNCDRHKKAIMCISCDLLTLICFLFAIEIVGLVTKLNAADLKTCIYSLILPNSINPESLGTHLDKRTVVVQKLLVAGQELDKTANSLGITMTIRNST